MLDKCLVTLIIKHAKFDLISAAKRDYKDCDCFLFILSSHGTFAQAADKENPGAVSVTYDVVQATDGQLPLPMLLDNFKASNCPSLAGKPKLFFIQVSPLTDWFSMFKEGDTMYHTSASFFHWETFHEVT